MLSCGVNKIQYRHFINKISNPFRWAPLKKKFVIENIWDISCKNGLEKSFPNPLHRKSKNMLREGLHQIVLACLWL